MLEKILAEYNAELKFTLHSFKVVGVCEILSFAEPWF